MVEFALENAQALKKRALRQSKVKEGQAGRTKPEEAPDGPEAARLGSPKQLRKRKRDSSQVCGHILTMTVKDEIHEPPCG